MIIECPPDVFRELEKGCGSLVMLKDEGCTFLYEAIGEASFIGDGSDRVCVEISSKEKRLFLIYDELEGWALGHMNEVLVIKSMDELDF